jgi:hypothetical protein
MSEYIDNYKNPGIKAYLQNVRTKNKSYMSICHYCDRSSIGIVAEGYLIYPACEVHTAIYDRKATEVLEKLGSDYDENGIPYWEK